MTSMWFHDVTHVLPRIHLDKDGRVRSFRELICLTDEEARTSICGRKDGKFSLSGMDKK